MPSILIAGYPYIKESYLKTFDLYRESVCFLLPKVWKAKGGKLIFKPPARDNIFKTKAFFYHSHYPVIGGLLKGWMPLFPLYLLKIRHLKVVFSPSEPILFTTLYQGFWTKLMGKKHIIFTWENVPYDQKLKGLRGSIQKLILKMNLLFCDAVVCGNKKGAEIFEKLTKKPIETIPLSGIDTEFFKKTSGEKKFKDLNLQDKIVFTFAGAIGYRKGVHLILESMAEVIKEIPNSYLIIAGSGEYEKEIKDLIDKLNLGSYIRLIEWLGHEDLRSLLSASDVFVYPSMPYGGWEEQFGYSMAEASLMEVPVISTRTGSIDEVIVNGSTGFLVDPDNSKMLKQAMVKLAQSEELRKTLGQSGRNYIQEHFSYQRVAEKFHNFFQKI